MAGLFSIIEITLIIIGINLEIKMNSDTQNYIETQGYYKSCTWITTDDDGSSLYKLSYEYTVNGEKYIVDTNYLTNNIPNIGAGKTIKYNPQNPAEAVVTSKNISKIVRFIATIIIFLPFVWIFPLIIVTVIAVSKNIITMKRTNNESPKIKSNKVEIKKEKIETKSNDDENYDPIKNL